MPAKPKTPRVEINEQFGYALEIMEHTRKNVFITGRAGTGKSTLLEYFRRTTRKKVAILAPTGVAALNVKGQTIHSFFGFRPNMSLNQVKQVNIEKDAKNIFKKLDAIVIDEISMVRADLLDCVDKFLRLNGPSAEIPFGGIQMIFVGDLYQLPPVVTGNDKSIFQTIYETPYFYSARVFDCLAMEFVELEKIYRQHDQGFINLLNAIRNKTATEEELEILNRKCMPDFEPAPDDFYIYLTTTNKLAADINSSELNRLKGPLFTFTAGVEGDFGPEYYPTATRLQVKPGAQIMMLNNDSAGRWVNGSIGKIIEIIPSGNHEYTILAELSNNEVVEITPYTWEIYQFDVVGKEIKSKIAGRFTQYPLMLAWAVTIHKGQGKTFDRVIIDIGRGTFTHGQMYVALSRCTTLDGIVLKRPVFKKHIWTDFKVVDFLTKYQYQRSEQICSLNEKFEIIKRAIRNHTELQITYLKPNDEKSRRRIIPVEAGEMKYQGKVYPGVRAYCLKRNQERVFRVDRILEISQAD